MALAFTTILVPLLVPPAAPGLALLLVTRNGVFDFFPVVLIIIIKISIQARIKHGQIITDKRDIPIPFVRREVNLSVLRWQTPNLNMLYAPLNQVHPRENSPVS